MFSQLVLLHVVKSGDDFFFNPFSQNEINISLHNLSFVNLQKMDNMKGKCNNIMAIMQGVF